MRREKPYNITRSCLFLNLKKKQINDEKNFFFFLNSVPKNQPPLPHQASRFAGNGLEYTSICLSRQWCTVMVHHGRGCYYILSYTNIAYCFLEVSQYPKRSCGDVSLKRRFKLNIMPINFCSRQNASFAPCLLFSPSYCHLKTINFPSIK